jgi:hypothetical protein
MNVKWECTQKLRLNYDIAALFRNLELENESNAYKAIRQNKNKLNFYANELSLHTKYKRIISCPQLSKQLTLTWSRVLHNSKAVMCCTSSVWQKA